MKLTSMVDYILQIDEIEPKAVNFSSITDIRNYQLNSYSKIVKYAEFLKQPLELRMFVPCDGNGNFLEETNRSTHTNLECEKYNQAKERVLFEGFELLRDVGYAWIFKYNVQGETLFYKKIEFGIIKSNKIEDLIIDFPEQLTITPNAIKQLGL